MLFGAFESPEILGSHIEYYCEQYHEYLAGYRGCCNVFVFNVISKFEPVVKTDKKFLSILELIFHNPFQTGKGYEI